MRFLLTGANGLLEKNLAITLNKLGGQRSPLCLNRALIIKAVTAVLVARQTLFFTLAVINRP